MGSPLKILVFSPFYPPHIGGLESHADEFNKHLAKRGAEISVFTPRLPVDAPEEETIHSGVRIVRFPAWEPIHNYPLPKYWPFFWTPGFWRSFGSIRGKDYDIVISRTRFFSTSLLALAYARWRRIPFLHIEHGSDYAVFNGSLKTFLGKCYDHTFGRMVFLFADRIVANSEASATFVKKISGRDATVIHRGIETEKILAIEPDQRVLGEKNGRVGIAYVGRLIDGKGVADLLAALEGLDRDDFIFHIVGEGPERNRLEKMARSPKLSGKVLFHGHQEHERAIAIMKACDIFVNPSYGEGMPTSVTEAALLGKAIVATDVGGTSEIITGNGDGYLIKAGDAKMLQKKLDALLADPELRKSLGEEAENAVSEKFSWKTSLEKYMAIIGGMREKKPRIFFLSSRHGGPFKQHRLVATELRKRGYDVEQRSDITGWIRSHFLYGNTIIITNVPLLFRFKRKNFIFNIKGNYRKERHPWKNPLGYLYPLNLLWSEKIVFPSIYLKEALGIDNAIVIPNAIPKKEDVQIKSNESGTVRIIMVTMFGFRKKSEGALMVVEALSDVRTNKAVRLDIFGGGSFEAEIRSRAAEIALPKNISVNFRGYSKDIDHEYRSSDIFAYWSDLDVMPNVFLEAMSHGLPIVANNFPTFAEILGDNETISDDIKIFSGTLEKIINDADCRKTRSIKSLERIEKFQVDPIVKRWSKIIDG